MEHLRNRAQCAEFVFENVDPEFARRSAAQRDRLESPDLRSALGAADHQTVQDRTRGTAFTVRHELGASERRIVLAGGALADVREH
jgi:hypothetical protein